MTSKSHTQITSNAKQPYNFALSLDSSQKKIKIAAKNKLTNEQFIGIYNTDQIKKIGFHSSTKGFYNRLKNAIESKNPADLRAYYSIHNNKMTVILEEINKYDDDSTKWSLYLKKKQIAAHASPGLSPLSISQSSSATSTQTTQQLQFVIKQVKEKFNNEREQRLKLEQRIEILETICSKLTKKLVKLTNEFKKDKDARAISGDLFGSKKNKDDIKLQSPVSKSLSNITDNNVSVGSNNDLTTIKASIDDISKKWGSELHVINQKMDEIRPKLVRLKTRRDFASEQAFIGYITNKLEQWDANKFGPILVRVLQSATGKAKHFIGYVGEPQKWNHTICKVKWFGLGKKQPEAVEWKALDVFLPLSSFYYPDCPHARAFGARNASSTQHL